MHPIFNCGTFWFEAKQVYGILTIRKHKRGVGRVRTSKYERETIPSLMKILDVAPCSESVEGLGARWGDGWYTLDGVTEKDADK